MKVLDDLIVAIAERVIRCIFSVAAGLVYVQFVGFALVGFAALCATALLLLAFLRIAIVGA